MRQNKVKGSLASSSDRKNVRLSPFGRECEFGVTALENLGQCLLYVARVSPVTMYFIPSHADQRLVCALKAHNRISIVINQE